MRVILPHKSDCKNTTIFSSGKMFFIFNTFLQPFQHLTYVLFFSIV